MNLHFSPKQKVLDVKFIEAVSTSTETSLNWWDILFIALGCTAVAVCAVIITLAVSFQCTFGLFRVKLRHFRYTPLTSGIPWNGFTLRLSPSCASFMFSCLSTAYNGENLRSFYRKCFFPKFVGWHVNEKRAK